MAPDVSVTSLVYVSTALLLTEIIAGSADVTLHYWHPSHSRQKKNALSPEEEIASSTNHLSCNNTFQPTVLRLEEGQLFSVNYTIVCRPFYLSDDQAVTFKEIRLEFNISDVTIATIEGNSSFLCPSAPVRLIGDLESVVCYGTVDIRGVSFGKTQMRLRNVPILGEDVVTARAQFAIYRLVVIKHNSVINILFLAVLGVMIIVYNFGFGCRIEWDLIVAIVKRPVAPSIGFCCQFLVMAPLSCGVAILLHMRDESGLGLLAIGAAPGGGGSNVFAYLLDGDLELSITMSFISTVASLGMTPLWIWALGRFFSKGDPKIKIPVGSVFSSLAVVTIPVVGGLILSRYKPEASKKMASTLKPMTGVIGFVFIGMGVYVYYPALVKVTWRTLVACLVVPLSGYTIGAASGAIFRQSRARWVTIALETGFQNLALSLMIVGTSLDQPESDLAGVVPICYMFISSSLAVLAFLWRLAYRLHRGDKPWKRRKTAEIVQIRTFNTVPDWSRTRIDEIPSDDGDGGIRGLSYASGDDHVTVDEHATSDHLEEDGNQKQLRMMKMS